MRDRDEIFVYTVSSSLTGVVAYRENYALGGMRKTTVYPQRVTHNNLDELTVSVSIFRPFFHLFQTDSFRLSVFSCFFQSYI